jgi:parallel beta-helix repeat protein
MKKHNNLVFFGIIVALSLMFTVHSTNILLLDSNIHHENNLKTSGLPCDPISISGNLGWETAAANEEWCTGDGTLEIPYVIENVDVDAQDGPYCIEIIGSDAHFIIRNCKTYNSIGNGILLDSVRNGKLINIDCYDNNRGITLTNSYDNAIENNFISNNIEGIFFFRSENNYISQNTVTSNSYGITAHLSNNNFILDNFVTFHTWHGIKLSQSHYNLVSGNIANDNQYGIYLWVSEDNDIVGNVANLNDRGILVDDFCYFNNFIGNMLSGNNLGIFMNNDNDNNIFTGNTIEFSNEIGVYVRYTENFENENNLFNENIFIGNTFNAIDDGPNNQWDDDTIGNYWDDYAGRDADDNGIGDIPYYIQDIQGNQVTQDNFPIWDDGPDNISPEITYITGPLDPVQIGDLVQITIDFTDPDEGDTHIATFEWGDEEIDAVDVDPGARTITYSHPYTVAGVYTLILTITDESDESDSMLYQYVVIFDPDGGFVTGGGWIDSPAGAFPADIDLTGKAHFGFVSKYKKGGHVPIGNTEFLFNAADLNFHSTSYEWLIIAGFKAKFKGSGTINGEGNYGFMLTAIDGELSGGADQFRIIIWDKDNNDAVIYDNDGSTDLGGGNIKIHIPK